MPQFKDREEFLDKLWDHLFPNEEDEDTEFFDHVARFFEDESNNQGGNNQGANNQPRRRQRQSSNAGNSGGTPRRRSRQTTGSGYGNSTWFGS